MASTGVQAILGVAFWFLVAHMYTPEEVGLGSTLIAATVFISYASLLGLNITLVKILPSTKYRTEIINSSLVLVFSTAIFISFLYVQSLPYLTPKLSFLTQNLVLSFSFIIFSAFSAVNLLTDSIFVAYRAAKYNLIIYTFQSLTKVALPGTLIFLGAFGIFASSGAAAILALLLSVYFLIKKFDYKPKFKIHHDAIKDLWKFSSANYISNLFNIAPTIIIPIIILNELGAAQAGYFYLAFMLANLLYSIAYSVAQSLFAEGSYGETKLKILFKRAISILATIMIPAGILLALTGPFLLQIFGKSYGEEARDIIIILALSAPAVAAYILSSVFLRITDRIYTLIAMNVLYALTISILSYVWANHGLVWIGFAWMIGHLAAALFAVSSYFFQSKFLFKKQS